MSLYLFLYNFIQLCGWCSFFLKVTLYLIGSKQIQEIYSDTHIILECFQCGAFLEIMHAILGIVKTRILPTTMQISSRIIIVLILHNFPSALSYGYLLIYFAWSSIEIVRYSYYTLNLVKKDFCNFKIPYFLIWCRYTFFIWLYPIGTIGEIITIWNAQKDISKYILWKNNDFNISWSVFCYPLYILYIPALIFMYGYLFNQRKKVLYNINNVNIKLKKYD